MIGGDRADWLGAQLHKWVKRIRSRRGAAPFDHLDPVTPQDHHGAARACPPADKSLRRWPVQVTVQGNSVLLSADDPPLEVFGIGMLDRLENSDGRNGSADIRNRRKRSRQLLRDEAPFDEGRSRPAEILRHQEPSQTGLRQCVPSPPDRSRVACQPASCDVLPEAVDSKLADRVTKAFLLGRKCKVHTLPLIVMCVTNSSVPCAGPYLGR